MGANISCPELGVKVPSLFRGWKPGKDKAGNEKATATVPGTCQSP